MVHWKNVEKLQIHTQSTMYVGPPHCHQIQHLLRFLMFASSLLVCSFEVFLKLIPDILPFYPQELLYTSLLKDKHFLTKPHLVAGVVVVSRSLQRGEFENT